MQKVFQFEHNSEKINVALGLSNKQDEKCRDIIFFSAFSSFLIGDELFDDDSEKPKAISTVTGDLQKALSLLEDELERNYLLFIFRGVHDTALDAIAKYKIFESIKDEEKKKLELILQLLDLKLEEKRKQEEDFEFYSPTEMFKKIELVKKSRYNFKRYLELIENDKES